MVRKFYFVFVVVRLVRERGRESKGEQARGRQSNEIGIVDCVCIANGMKFNNGTATNENRAPYAYKCIYYFFKYTLYTDFFNFFGCQAGKGETQCKCDRTHKNTDTHTHAQIKMC